MQRTKSKILSILLILAMLLSLLPTTALAASYAKISVNDILLEDNYYLKSNSATGSDYSNTEPSSYVAWYKGGVLTLNGYDGKGIAVQGANAGELTIKLIGNNTINSTNSQQGVSGNGANGSITITSESNGKLNINLSDANRTVYGIDGDENSVTITGSADVTIIAKAENADENSYGIYSKAAVSILGDASVNITSKTPSSTRTNACYGIYSKKDVTIDTEGTIQINVHDEAGTAEAASYGVYSLGNLTLTKVGGMTVKWKKAGVYGAPYYPITASFSDTDHAINVDETNCYASYRKGTPRKVTVQDGQLTGPGVPNAKDSGSFLQSDKVNITPAIKKSWDDQEIPFKEWTSSDVTLDKSATTASNFFTVPGKDVTVTAKHSPFVGTPTFTPTGTTGNEGTLTFKTVVKADETYEGFRLVKEGNENNESSYISIRSDTTSTSSPYEYSYETRRLPGVNQVDEGNYYVVAYLNNHYYLGEKFTVDYTAAPTVTYPDHVRVYNASGDIKSLSDKQYLAANNATNTSDNYDGSQTYVARYDKSSGTLYLKDYHGVATDGRILADGDLNIEVVSDSSFSTSVSATTDLYGIQANGKLKISGTGKLTVTANGDGDVYGIYADKGVTIAAPLEVNVGKAEEDSSKNGPVCGIYAQSGTISLSGNDMTVTATGGNEAAYGVYNQAQTSSSAAGSSNITITGKLTVNLNKGSSNVGIYTGSGGTITLNGATVIIPGNFKIGIYNNNGNVIIKNNSNVTLASDVSNSWGVYAKYGGDLIIENSTVSISTKGYAASLENGGLTIKNSTVDLTMDAETYRVVNTYHSATNTIDLSGSGSVTLTASGNQTGSMIGGTVSITTPGTKCVKGTYYDYGSSQNYDGEYDGSSKTVLQFVHEDPAPATTYEVTVTNGTGSGNYAEGETVTITANAASDGMIFDKWVVEDGSASITLADATSATTTFTMPASAVSVKATYKTTPGTTYNLTTQVNGGHGTISASKTGLTAGSTETITFTPDAGYKIDTVTVNGTATSVSGNTLNVTMDGNKNVVVTYKAIEYTITVTDGKATVGAGSEISKAAEGTAVTLTANAAPSDKVFDKWEVVSGGITLADANSATTTFTMPASAVSVKATYKNAPHTHNYNQETVKPEALKTPAGCTNNAVYFKSCSCGAISTTDTFVAMNTALGHAYGSDWKYDSTNHWHECSRCHDKKDEAAHDYGSDNVCDTCGYDKTVPHTHNLTLVAAKAATCTTAGNSAYYTCDGCDKWFADATGSVEITDKTSVEIAPLNHDWNAPAYTWNADNTVCTATRTCKRDAGHKETATATVTSAQTKAPTCTAKGETTYTAAFTEAWANTQTKTVDNIAALGHDWSTAWTGDSTGHWHKCTRCDATTTKAAHDYGSDNICDTCGYDKTVPHTHNLTLVAAKSATCTAPGNADYWKCNCGKLFSDDTATTETTLAAVTIAALGHDHNGPWVTTDENEHWKVCAREGCNEQLDKAVHNPSAWVNVDDGHHRQTCIVCEKELEYERCIFGQPLKYNATSHWEECTKCGNKQNEAAHEFLPNSDKCTGCDYTKSSTITIITPTQPGDSKPAGGNPSTGAVSSPVGYVFVGLAVVGALCLGAKKLTKKHED